jgi:hypothetical protein
MTRTVFFLLVTLTTLFVVQGCKEQLVEVPENIFAAEDNLLVESKIYSTFDIIDDFVSGSSFFDKNKATLLPFDAKIIYIDSTFDDGDGLEGLIDFGPLGNSKPYGTLCPDGLYRSGKLPIVMLGDFFSTDIVIQARINDEHAFYSGNGEVMNQLIGHIEVESHNLESFSIKVDSAIVRHNGHDLQWSCERNINWISNGGPGGYGDIYQLSGTASGKDREQSPYDIVIEKPLEKRLEQGCAKTFIGGEITLHLKGSNKVMRINYDPFNNKACDNIAEIEINGRRSLIDLN